MSDLTDKIKCSFLQAVIVLILLYGCTAWTLTKRKKKKLNVNNTRMLWVILNKSWRQYSTNQQLYSDVPPIMKTIQVRWTRHVGYCWRSKDELINNMLLWTPSHGQAKAGWPANTYIQKLFADIGFILEDVLGVMDDWDRWQERVREIHAGGMTWWWSWQHDSLVHQLIFFIHSSLFINLGNRELNIDTFENCKIRIHEAVKL